MSVDSHDSSLSPYVEVLRRIGARNILEFGTTNAHFCMEIVRTLDWTASVNLHCVDYGGEDFDSEVRAASAGSSADIVVTKHLGSETEVNDAIMRAAEQSPYNAIFISSASSAEALLTALMVSHESLAPGGVIGISHLLDSNQLMAPAIDSFRGMYSDSYEESTKNVFVKQ